MKIDLDMAVEIAREIRGAIKHPINIHIVSSYGDSSDLDGTHNVELVGHRVDAGEFEAMDKIAKEHDCFVDIKPRVIRDGGLNEVAQVVLLIRGVPRGD